MMQVERIELEEVKRFSPILLNYLKEGDSSLANFYNYFPTIDNFEKQIKQKSFNQERRDELVQALEEQYQGLDINEPVSQNLTSLKEKNTYTITTGHQLSILTGPLFFHYKIVTVINLCKELSEKYPKNNFVPVFWMATEDHDFEEISSVKVDGQQITWETEQSGPVGRFDPSGLKSVLEKVPGDTSLFEESYLNESTLAGAVRRYVNELYGHEGLIIIDGDDKRLKKAITNLIIEDCCNNNVNRLSEESSKALEQLGYKQQVFPREINFFYLKENFRNRIVKKDDSYKVLNSEESWTEEELKEAIRLEPWKFSPNVLLRPLYQEVILPNLAYVGGPAEVAYWLQLKSSFEHYEIPFPMVIPRNFGLLVRHDVERKRQKTGLPFAEFFQDKDQLIKSEVIHNSDRNLSATTEKEKIEELWNTLANRVKSLDPTLETTSQAYKQKGLKNIENLEKKMIRAEKRNQSDRVNQINWLIDSMFPNGQLQERNENFLTFTSDIPDLINQFLKHLKPLDFRFHILIQK